MKGDSQKRIDNLLKRIKSLKIQGAENVARAGIKAFLLEPTRKNAKRIIKVRATEPLLQNAIKILLKSKDQKKTSEKFLNELKSSHEKIAKFGSDLIKGDINVFSHCHSSTVIDILKMAKKRKRKFVVYTIEVEPRLQGRMTAEELSEYGIKVVVGPDLSVEELVKNCDIVLFGADAFTKTSVYNKIGTDIICKLAQDYHIPRYSCGVSMKFSKKVKIEKRSGKEVWDERRKKIDVIYPAFDKVNYNKITGIISELGVLGPKSFVKEARKKLKEISKTQII